MHRWFLGEEFERQISYEEAVVSWYDQVYALILDAIRETDMAREFPGRIEADLYVWLIEHLWYLRDAGQLEEDVSLEAAARIFGTSFSSRPRRRLTRAVHNVFARPLGGS